MPLAVWVNRILSSFLNVLCCCNLILVGASAICWALWLSRNGIVFDKSSSTSYMQFYGMAARVFLPHGN
uniref:Uncharacterized protein n=1 Tax=Oryza sativa subsp. japonica TaxID=39947 RepID=Q10GC6_ORYSJ|nr:hypothetical protein LOC_Os03g43464 [Oryza sativa Japonica Group]